LDTAIENEARVIEKLKANGGHKNITTVLEHGWLDEERYFIDMEACILNLEDYISSEVRSVVGPSKYFDPQCTDASLGCLSFRGIMEDITNGLNFIHSHKEWYTILYDFQTNLVLLSARRAAWAIADFEITVEGTSKRAYTTKYARGTECYRAPELITRDSPVVSMKSDIWALGCILYELLSAKTAFRDEIHVYQYTFHHWKLDDPSLPEQGNPQMRAVLRNLVQSMLDAYWWKRPSASEILDALKSFYDSTTDVYLLVEKLDGYGQPIGLYHDSESWDRVSWKQCW
jgi:serine/threonine protein kinase